MKGIKFLSGCGVAAVLLIWPYGIGEAVPSAGPPSNGEYQQAQAEQAGPQPLPPAVTEEEKPATAIKANPCDNPKGREESDLCQQWRMAEASEELVRLTDRQNTLTMIEAGLLAVTIIFTAVAAWAAVVAAKAAINSVKVMRNAERPYLIPGGMRLEDFWKAAHGYDGDLLVKVMCDFKNIGRSVGFLSGLGIAHEVCFEGRQGGVEPTVREGFGRIPISVDATRQFGLPIDAFQIGAADVRAIRSNTKTLYVYGFIRYVDLFGVVRRTGFIFEFVQNPTMEDGGAFAVCAPHRYWYDVEEKPEGEQPRQRPNH